jgi:tetratricopeptide (TPR) repeat protein
MQQFPPARRRECGRDANPNVGDSMLTRHLAAAAALLVVSRIAIAQTAAQHVAEGDEANAAMNAPAALHHYKAAIAIDSNDYAALWKASREAVSLGEFDTSKTQQKAYYTEGEGYAKRATHVNPAGTDGWFVLARALGRTSLTLGKKERVHYAGEIRNDALESLKLDSANAGSLHVMGRWNAEIMRLSGMSRFFAKTFLGGKVFDAASWDSAVFYMNKAVKLDPTRIVHHLDLGEIYMDRNHDGDKALAKEQLTLVVEGKPTEYNDPHYKQQAQELLAKLNK